jgi:hypothetical protein
VWVFVGFFQKPPDLSIPRNAPQIKSDAPADETSHDPAATAEKPAGHANTDDASKATHGNDNATNRGGH